MKMKRACGVPRPSMAHWRPWMVTPASDPGAPCVFVAEGFCAMKVLMDSWNSSKWKITGRQCRNPAVIADLVTDLMASDRPGD